MYCSLGPSRFPSGSNPTLFPSSPRGPPPARGRSHWIKIQQPRPPLQVNPTLSDLLSTYMRSQPLDSYPTATTSHLCRAHQTSHLIEVIAVGSDPTTMTSPSLSSVSVLPLLMLCAVGLDPTAHDLPSLPNQPALPPCRGRNRWIKSNAHNLPCPLITVRSKSKGQDLPASSS